MKTPCTLLPPPHTHTHAHTHPGDSSNLSPERTPKTMMLVNKLRAKIRKPKTGAKKNTIRRKRLSTLVELPSPSRGLQQPIPGKDTKALALVAVLSRLPPPPCIAYTHSSDDADCMF